MKLLEMMTGAWAVLPETLIEMQGVYATHLRGEKIDIAAVEQRMGRPLASTQPQYEVMPGGVAVLRATGVMAPKANIMMEVSGGISTQMLTRQFQALAADPRVKSVVFAPDSPGGNVQGIPALVGALRALADAKPTVTVAEGVMASAMYWVGTAANAVFIEGETDLVGSIGVVKTLGWEPAQPNQRTLVRGKFKRLSTDGQAPSAEVLAAEEAQLDYLYTLFVDSVAAHRGVSSEVVLEHMADGRVFIGQQAVSAGLVDGVSTVDAMVEKLATNPAAYATRRKAVVVAMAGLSLTSASAGDAPTHDTTTATTHPEKGLSMSNDIAAVVSRESLERDHAALFATLKTEFTTAGATAERARIQGVLAQGAALPGHDALVQQLAFEGCATPEQAAMALVAAEGKARTTAAAAFTADAPKPAASSAAPADAVDKTRAELAAEAKAYAKEHGVDIVAAMKALGIQA